MMVTPSKVYLWDDRALYSGTEFVTDMHSHHAVQIVLGLGGKMQICTAKEFLEFDVAFIPADVPHQIGNAPSRIVALYLDNESADAKRLECEIFQKGSVRQFPRTAFLDIIQDLGKISVEQVDCMGIFAITHRIVERVLPSGRQRSHLDARITKVLEILKTGTGSSVSVSHLAESMGLSLSRLGHLFKEQTGFPIRRYFLWRKLINSIRAMETAASLTEAAHNAGFSDSSHMNRTFKRMFGIKPSFFQNNSKFVQVIDCSA